MEYATYNNYNEEISLEAAIHDAIAGFLGIPHDHILSRPNKDKYYDTANPQAANDGLREVFELMRALNRQGVGDDTLCRSERGGSSFAEALGAIADDFAKCCLGRAVHYVELGPEPVKTSFILERLGNSGVDIRDYTAVDINPSSRDVMAEHVGAVLGAGKFHHLTADYHTLDGFSLADDGVPALVTMLGFQEGNESPARMAGLFRRLLRSGDVLLAEMQLLAKADWSSVFRFYDNDNMRRFSKLGFREVFGDLESEYGVVLVPVPMEISGTGFVAVTTERIVAEGDLFDKIYVSNYCIKYSLDDFRKIREFDGGFKIVSQRLTGDNSVGFQLSARA